IFCAQAGYEARFVPAGFLPKSAEERLLLAPPEHNLDTNSWKEQTDLDAFRRSLEGLL
ncbi:MAG: DUF3110 domain-containing protein, partial [Synechococcaceae bacterium WBB_32_011]|nr:DUF3110 domain-containing protein [Synechococcaceae bacterium WBB_32_011]